MNTKIRYPSDTTDEEWEFVASYLTLMKENAPQREYDLREVFDALRWMCRSGSPWRYLPHHFPPWQVVYQQTQRWIRAGVFEAIVNDLRAVIRKAQGRNEQPSAVVFDARTLKSTPESGNRAGFDGHKKTKGSKVHMAVDTLGNLLSLVVTPANEQERAQVAELASAVQEVTGNNVELAYVDQGYTGDVPAQAAHEHGVKLFVVKLEEAKKGFVLLPRRWVVERSFGWLSRFRRLARDYERLPETVAGFHYMVFAILLLAKAADLLSKSA
jgi:transposase